METTKELTVVDVKPVNARALQAQVNAIQEAMQQVMTEGVHFGKIPGCGDKPTLLKPGAEKIGLMFRLLAALDVKLTHYDGGHREYIITCSLKDVAGNLIGQGVGSCSTLESKYRWRKAERLCPKCGKATIIKSTDFKTKVPNGWLCFEKRGGCGAKFPLGSQEIEGQIVGRVENPDIADCYNTCLKIAKKRAHVDAILTCTAASDIFTQDIEELAEVEEVKPKVVVLPKKQPKQKFKYSAEALKEYMSGMGAKEKSAAWAAAQKNFGAKNAGDFIETTKEVPDWSPFQVREESFDLSACDVFDAEDIPFDSSPVARPAVAPEERLEQLKMDLKKEGKV